jgi:hypothetical protein
MVDAQLAASMFTLKRRKEERSTYAVPAMNTGNEKLDLWYLMSSSVNCSAMATLKEILDYFANSE